MKTFIQASSALLLCLCLLLGFQPAAHATLIPAHDYALKNYWASTKGIISGSSNPISDLVTPNNDFFMTKEIWQAFSSPNNGNCGWIEIGGIKGTNIEVIGTWIGYFTGQSTCDANGGYHFTGQTYGNWNPQDSYAVYEIKADNY